MDTVGAWPTFECEVSGQSEAIATNLTVMAGLKVPIVTVLVGEGGSGGALGICMGNSIGVRSICAVSCILWLLTFSIIVRCFLVGISA